MRGCAERMPDFAKCRTAEQVPRAEEKSVLFPCEPLTRLLGVSHQRLGVGAGSQSAWLGCSVTACAWDAPPFPGREEAAGVTTTQLFSQHSVKAS